MSNKPENIYDSNEFFDNYIDLRNDKIHKKIVFPPTK